MPEVLDWQRGEPRLILQRAVQELTAGNLVVFPTEAGYQLAGSALLPGALAALAQRSRPEQAALAVRGLSDALRWAPHMSTTAQRLCRRVWPGPVILIVDSRPGMASQPQSSENAGKIHMWMPAHEAPLAALQLLRGPMIFAPLLGGATTMPELSAALDEKVTLIVEDGPPTGRLATTVVRVQGGEWKVAQSGAVTADKLQTIMPTTVLFVCTGNTCRSPMAEGLCKKLLAERLSCSPKELPQRGFLVLSAGLAALTGAKASPDAVEVAAKLGADVSEHFSQPLSPELLARADYLFVMTASHLRAVLPFCPPLGLQPRLLASDGSDVPDPIGAEPAVYRDCAEQILGHLRACLQDIQLL